jgi:TIR domain/Domain of unknown function (DUF4062)
MSVLPGFQQDIFISYSHIDNEPLTEGQKGWVDTFHRALETRIKQVIGVPAAVWRDPEVQGNTFFKREIPDQLKKTAMLIAVVSPPYMTSEWCQDELQMFCAGAEATGGIGVGNQARIFKVIKFPIAREKYPPAMQDLIGYEFFEWDARTGSPHEFYTEVAGAPRQSFFNKVDDLAQQIKALAESLGVNLTSAAPRAVPASGTSVYLAETTSDLAKERDAIRRQLEQRGHTVLPDTALPPYAPAYQDAVREQLDRAQMSVHLVGEHYGVVPEAATQSTVVLQHELAAERSARGPFPRLIWMPPGLVSSDTRQQQFIDHVQGDTATHKGAEFLQTNIEELKTTIDDTVRRRESAAAAAAAAIDLPPRADADRRPQVYLICDQQDRDDVVPLEDALFEANCDVTLPAFEGDEAEIRADHRDTLVMCDAVLIYVGRAGEPWVRAQLREIQKARGYEQDSSTAARTGTLVKALYFGPPDSPAKRPVKIHDVMVMRHFDAFTPDMLGPFLERVRARDGRPT